MSYRVYPIDIGTATANPQEIIPPGQQISEVVILSLPSGGQLNLHFGISSDAILVENPISFKPTEYDEQQNGLYYTIDTATPGAKVNVIVVSGASLGAVGAQ